MASALPIVATRVGGVPDLVVDGCGTLVPPRDATALAAALQLYISDAALRASAGAAARRHVRQSYSTEQFGPGVLRLVEEAAS
jgi:glycosyltransferase involved in cell wall biosynthesis